MLNHISCIWIDCLLDCLFVHCLFFISFKFQSITDRLLQSMEVRNQSVDDLLLEIDQSIAVSRHTMRYSFFGDDKYKYNAVIIIRVCPLIYMLLGFLNSPSVDFSFCLCKTLLIRFFHLGNWMEKLGNHWQGQTGIKFNFR